MSSVLYYDPSSNPVLGRITRFDPSVDVPQSIPNTISNPNLSAVSELASTPFEAIGPTLIASYKVLNGQVVSMTQQDKDNITAAQLASLLSSNRTSAKSYLDGTGDISMIEKAIVEGVVSQIANPLRQWIVAFKAQVALASTLADLKLRIATLPDMPDITFSQVKTYLKNKIDSGQIDNQ